MSDALVPNLGGTDRTVASLEFDVTVPTTKPVTNVAQLLHCRSESQLDIQDLRVAPCSNIIASRQYELWPVIPELTSPGVALVSSELVAAGQTTSFVIQFVAVTEGATTVVVACEGMNFTNTVATYLGESATCVGKMNEVTISLASGQAIQSSVATEISLQLVFNPKSTGPTVWSFTTFW